MGKKLATLIGIATHKKSRGSISEHKTVQVSSETGLENDFRGAQDQNTQVTILSLSQWQQACHDVAADLHWTKRRANLLIEGIEFDQAMLGQKIQIGEIVLEITDETDPCSRMDELKLGLKEALTPNWRGGVRCRVLQEGVVKVGDNVQILPKE